MAYSADKYTQYVTVASGDTLSSHFHVGAARFIAIHVPSVASTAMYLRGSITHAGSYYQVYNGNTLQTYTVASGQIVVGVGNVAAAIPHMKLELQNAQSDVRTFGITAFPR